MDTAIFTKQLQSVLEDFASMQAKAQHHDLSDLPKSDRQALVTRAVAAVHRIAGRQSSYAQEVERLMTALPQLHEHTSSVIGVAKALLDDMTAGYTKSLVEIVHGDIFGDFLEMAEYLCESNYKDAAAVIAGSTLESHLRELCRKAGVSVELSKGMDMVPKKVDSMNSDLASALVYSKLEQKNVTAWLGVRNNAAHGKYSEYDQKQVMGLISGVRDFITRNPA